MKRCPVCQQSFTQGTTCPTCNILLIDLETNSAVKRQTGRKAVNEEAVMADEETWNQQNMYGQQQNADPYEQQQDYYGMPKPNQNASDTFDSQSTEEKKSLFKRDKSQSSGSFNMNIPIPALIAVAVVAVVLIVLILVIPRIGGSSKTSDADYYDNVIENTDLEQEQSTDFTVDYFDTYSTEHFEFELPGYWWNYCSYDKGDEYITFYHLDSQYNNGDGWLFTVVRVPTQELEYYSNYTLLSQKGDYSYILETPSYQAYPNEDDIANDYHRLLEDKSYIRDSFFVLDSEEETNLLTNSGDYIFYDSDSRYIEQYELDNLTPEQCKIARNEIFARHGRRFKDEALQSYFDSKDWYNGTIEPDDFSESVLNSYEKANANTILQYEKDHNYL